MIFLYYMLRYIRKHKKEKSVKNEKLKKRNEGTKNVRKSGLMKRQRRNDWQRKKKKRGLKKRKNIKRF